MQGDSTAEDLQSESIVNWLNQKCSEESTAKYLMNELTNTLILLKTLDAGHTMPELEQIVLRKWADGRQCNNSIVEHFRRVR